MTIEPDGSMSAVIERNTGIGVGTTLVPFLEKEKEMKITAGLLEELKQFGHHGTNYDWDKEIFPSLLQHVKDLENQKAQDEKRIRELEEKLEEIDHVLNWDADRICSCCGNDKRKCQYHRISAIIRGEPFGNSEQLRGEK